MQARTFIQECTSVHCTHSKCWKKGSCSSRMYIVHMCGFVLSFPFAHTNNTLSPFPHHRKGRDMQLLLPCLTLGHG